MYLSEKASTFDIISRTRNKRLPEQKFVFAHNVEKNGQVFWWQQFGAAKTRCREIED